MMLHMYSGRRKAAAQADSSKNSDDVDAAAASSSSEPAPSFAFGDAIKTHGLLGIGCWAWGAEAWGWYVCN